MSSNVAQTEGNLQPRRTCSEKGQLVVGILLMLSSSLTVVFGIVAVSLPTIYYAYGGNPLWTGAVILITGILCAYAGKGTNKCVTTSALVMSIISIVFAADQILWMSVAAARENWYNDHCTGYYNNYYNYDYYYGQYSDCGAEIAIDAVLIVLGLFELGFSIAAVSVLSSGTCCRTRQQPTMGVVYHAGQPVVLQGGYVQSMAPVYPPQTHIVTQSGQMYVHQPVAPYPGVQVQYTAGQPQQYPVAGQPQQYPVAGQPQQYPVAGQPQQYPPSGQPQQYPPSGQQQHPATGQQNPAAGQPVYPGGQAQQQYPTGGQAQQPGGQPEQGINPFNPPPYNDI